MMKSLTRRRQLFEFNDLSTVPKAWRESVVEALGRTLDWGGMLQGLVPHLARFYSEARVREVLDLGAGTGIPAAILVRELLALGIEPPRTYLTDLFPLEDQWVELEREHAPYISFIAEPVDATSVDTKRIGQGRARQLINIFHHFPEEVARGVLEDAIKARQPIFISEQFFRRPTQFLNFAPAGIASLYVNPLFTKEHRLAKALWTWCSPVMLGISIWDGIISTMRIYEPADLMRMVQSIDGHEEYSWRHGTFSYLPKGEGFYFCGVPHRRA